MFPQSEFNFNQPSGGDGVNHWHHQRERASHRLAKRLGLPLEHKVEVWLKDGVVLRGQLRLKEAVLFLESVDERTLELTVDGVDFHYAEMESCVLQD
jgi:hypothetical protein